MSVEIEKNSSSNPPQTEQHPERPEERIEHKFTTCRHCQAQVILLARTIQTFCYRCGEPVTKLDKANMYYEEL